MFSRSAVFLLFSGLVLAEPPGSPLVFEVESMQRRDLPDDFPYHMLGAGFAVLKVRIVNPGEEGTVVSLEDLEAYNGKSKRLERALPTEIAPEILKYYRSGSLGVHGGAYSGYPGYYPPAVNRSETGGAIPSVAGTVDASTGTRIRERLEHYEIKPALVEPGMPLEGFLYLKSKQSGNALKEGFLQFQGRRVPFLKK